MAAIAGGLSPSESAPAKTKQQAPAPLHKMAPAPPLCLIATPTILLLLVLLLVLFQASPAMDSPPKVRPPLHHSHSFPRMAIPMAHEWVQREPIPKPLDLPIKVAASPAKEIVEAPPIIELALPTLPATEAAQPPQRVSFWHKIHTKLLATVGPGRLLRARSRRRRSKLMTSG